MLAAGRLTLGSRSYDLTTRALVMGVLNRTPDSFFDRGAYWDLDAFWRRADRLVAEGADLVDVGGVKAGEGAEVSVDEELDRVVPAVSGLRQRFDVPLSVDTWRSAVAAECFRAGAVMGNDISGFADPGYLPAAAAAGATVVATHIRLRPRVPDPEPHYADVVRTVTDFLVDRARAAAVAGIAPERIVVDPGLDLGKTPAQSRRLLLASGRLAGLGYPLLVVASNKDFVGGILGLGLDDRTVASLGAHAIGISLGARLVRTHAVVETVRVRDTLAAVAGAA
ncbi:MAG: dihydropteroate synthase [Acidimicrobiales bacterium]